MSSNASHNWLKALSIVQNAGFEVAPRGKRTIELLQHTHRIDMRRPVVDVPERKLNYRFMAAEAYWILSGDNRVETIAPYNSKIAEFSDDGQTFFGAYGPRIMSQLDYVVETLLRDRDSRQAGLTIWRENPPTTKDVPCTVAIFAAIRERTPGKPQLHLSVYMRSNDLWLGFPYDVFNFSMLAHLICARLNTRMRATWGPGVGGGQEVTPGTLNLTAASSHLYEPQWLDARLIADRYVDSLTGHIETREQDTTPIPMFLYADSLLEILKAMRERGNESMRWWVP